MVRESTKLRGKLEAEKLASLAARKREITAWDALVWAYANENVRAAGGIEPARRDYSTALAMQRWGETGVKASLDGWWSCHIDAVVIDARVKRLTDGRQYTLIARAAEARVPISPIPQLEETLPHPELVNTGRGKGPKVINHPTGRRPWYCPLVWEGPTPEERARAERLQASLHGVFLAVLDALIGIDGLERWSIKSRGLTNCDESLTSESRIHAVCPEVA
jgi:hypothetical protein